VLTRLIQRRTVAGWQSSSPVIWAAGNPVQRQQHYHRPRCLPPPPPQIVLQLLDVTG
jgi:hypothetical protein